ncbi:MAG: tetratricopeptide repeat protein [Spirochaetota bacterium]
MNTDKQNNISLQIKESQVLFNKGDYISSLEVLQSVLKEDPTNFQINYNLAIVLIKMEEYEKAINHLDVITNNEYQFIHYNHTLILKGYTQAMMNDLKGAKKTLSLSLKYDGKNMKALSILSYIHYLAKEYDVALRIYDRILEIDSKNSTALNSKGFILIETDKNIDEGLELCKKAYKINPNSPAILDSIAWAYYKKGNIDNSLTYIKRAFELSPNNPEIKQHLKKIISS